MRFPTISSPNLAKSAAVSLCFAAALLNSCAGRIKPDLLERVRQGTNDIQINGAVLAPLVGDRIVPIVEVRLNGRGPYRFLLDAGGNVVSIRQSVAREIGAVVLQKLSSRSVVRIESLEMSGMLFRDVHAVGEPVLDVDGVIGFNVFREGLLTLDYVQRQLRWERGTLPEPNGRDVIAYELRDRMPYVSARIGKTIVSMNLDTGASDSFIFPLAAARSLPLGTPLSDGPEVWNQATGRMKTQAADLKGPLVIGEHTIHHPRVLFKSSLDEYLIGSGFLRDFTVTFDTTNRRVKLLRRPQP